MAHANEFIPMPQSRRLAIVSVLVMAVLCVLSQMTFNVGARKISFLMVPCLAIYVWPRGANPTFSILGICALGFFQDFLSYGPIGLWALTWLILFLALRPEARAKPVSFLGQLGGISVVLAAVVVVQWGLAKFVLGQIVDMKSLAFLAIIALAVFPPIFGLRTYFAKMFTDRDENYFQTPQYEGKG